LYNTAGLLVVPRTAIAAAERAIGACFPDDLRLCLQCYDGECVDFLSILIRLTWPSTWAELQGDVRYTATAS
jgi:hypothetical protein